MSKSIPGRSCALAFALCLFGCATVQDQGDQAFKKGNCDQALENYEEAEEAGVKDPEMFHRAAQCALSIGDLALAERHYSYAIRYGAGVDVARELAGFYIRTSNYVSAVRVYQYLLHQESDKQPVYNNLGTALMYAGKPFDAESYLMVAQQMRPDDPTPYVNLGLLYDRHLKQPWLAINFYDCYNELTRGRAQNAEMVAQRSSELRERYHRLYESDAVKCGQAYQPAEQVVMIDDLKQVVEKDLPDQDPAKPTETGTNNTDPTTDPDVAGEEQKPPVIEPQITDYVPPSSEPVETAEASLARARRAYDTAQWAQAVGLYSSVPLSKMRAEDQKYLGLAYKEQLNWAMASHWLELALTSTEDLEIVSALFDVYERGKQPDRIATMCKRYGNAPKYEKITKRRCESSASKE